MYFWNSDRLAEELRAGTVSEWERAKYYLVFTGLMATAVELLQYDPEPVSAPAVTLSVVNVLAACLGSLAAYRINRMGDNRDFVGRIICLSLPVGLRVLVAGLVAALALGICVGGLAPGLADHFLSDSISWPDTVFYSGITVLLYWRLCLHISRIAKPEKQLSAP